MKSYVMATGIIFALLVLAHVARVAAEGPQIAKDPFFILATVVPAALCLWAWRLLKRPAP